MFPEKLTEWLALVEMNDGTLVLAGSPCTPEAMRRVLT